MRILRHALSVASLLTLMLPAVLSHAAATAGAVAGASGGASDDTPPMTPASPVGATGYFLVDGVSYRGAAMFYCPPQIGYVHPKDIERLFWSGNQVINETHCLKNVTEYPMVSAQEFVDEVLGHGAAKVVSVAPFITRNGFHGVIYYRSSH